MTEGHKTRLGSIPADWEVEVLGQLLSFSSGKVSDYASDPSARTFPVLGSNGVLGSLDDWNFEGGFVIGRVGACGSLRYVSDKIWASDNTILAKPVSARVDEGFLYYVIGRCHLEDLATKTAQPLLTQQNLKPLRVPLPPLPEQHKIAEILRSVDEAIEWTEAVIAVLREVKRGMMQELLTKGIGDRSTKDTSIGRIPVEWSVVGLDEVASVRYGLARIIHASFSWAGRGACLGPHGCLWRGLSLQGALESPLRVGRVLWQVGQPACRHTAPWAVAFRPV